MRVKLSKLFILASVILGLLIVLAISSTACGGNTSTPSLSGAVLFRSLDPQTKQPVERTNVFTADSPVIYCAVKLSNAPTDAKVTAVWVYIQGEASDLKNYKVADYSVTTHGTGYVPFELNQPPDGWLIGDYEVRFLINDQEKLTVPFKVLQIVPTTEEAYLSEATMCRSVDSETKQPVDKADVFSPDTPIIYCSVKLSEAPPNTEVRAVWVYTNKITILNTDVRMESGTRYLAFSLQSPESGWTVGDYAVSLVLNGQEKFTVPFKVQ